MTPAGVNIYQGEQPTPRTIPTDTGPGFVVAAAEKGPLYKECRSFAEVVNTFVGHDGRTAAYSILYDGAEKFFEEGGSVLHISRHLGTAPVRSSVSFDNTTGEPTIKVEAANYGAFYNGWEPAIVVDGSTFQIVVTDSADNDAEVVASPAFSSVAEAATWGTGRDDVIVTDLEDGTGNPAAASATAMTGGTDDVTNTTDATRQAALARLPKSLGPGQEAVWGDGTAQAILDLQAHAAATNRVPVPDLPDVASTSALETVAAAGRAGSPGRELAVWPWVNVGGVLAGQTRKVPPSALVMGRIARNDADGLPPNQPAAADLGTLSSVLSVTQDVPIDDATLDELAAAGINVIRPLRTASGGTVFQLYDYLTLADPQTHPQRVDFGTARLIMAITAQAEQIGLPYVQKLIDGKGLLLSEFQGRLQGMLKRFWDAGALYGETAEQAYRVDVGSGVNTRETLLEKKIKAQVHIRPSVPGRNVEIGLVTVPITAEIAA